MIDESEQPEGQSRRRIREGDPRKEPAEDKAFAERMKNACDRNDMAPSENGGRLVWIQEELKRRGMEVALQSIHRWYHGRARPRNEKMKLLAQVLGVDEGWLSMGGLDEFAFKMTKPRRPVLDGSVYVVMGLMQLSNISCGWPDEDDAPAVHFSSILGGEHRRFHVAYAFDRPDGEVTLHIPIEHAKFTVVVCRLTGSTSVNLWRLPKDLPVESISRRGDYIDVKATIEGKTLHIGDTTIKAAVDLEKAFE